MRKYFNLFSKLTFIFVMLVIAAGGIVRMTGSGMGCPDWPLCFGYLVPPIEKADFEWQANKEYQTGQMVVHENAIWIAKKDFSTSESYAFSNWSKFIEHDYVEYNAKHTWTEYMNRWVGALLGLISFFMVIFAFFDKHQKSLTSDIEKAKCDNKCFLFYASYVI